MEPDSESSTKTLPESQPVKPASTLSPIATPSRKSGMLMVSLGIAAIAIVGLIIFGALPRIFSRQSLVEETKKANGATLPVSVAIAQAGSPIEEFVLPGSTQAIQVASIYARVNGYLGQRFVNIGDQVKAGQVLATIDTPEIDQQVQAAQSSVSQAVAQVENAREAYQRAYADLRTVQANVRKGQTDLQFYTAEVKRYTILAKQGAVSLEDRDAHVQQYNGAVATLESLQESERSQKATMKSAAANVKAAESALDTTRAQLQAVIATRSFQKVTAPFAGIITKRNVDAGALITSGSSQGTSVLFEVAKTDMLRVFVYVPEQYVPYIKQGQKAHLSFPEYPRKDFIGDVTNVSGGLDEVSKTLQVEIHVANATHELFPGMYAKVKFQSPATYRLPRIPASTLQTRASGSYVFVVDASNVAHLHKLDVGRDLGGSFEVAKGVVAGDKVVMSPPDTLSDGMKVDPVVVPEPKKDDGK